MTHVLEEHTSSFDSVLNRWFNYLTVSSVADCVKCLDKLPDYMRPIAGAGRLAARALGIIRIMSKENQGAMLVR